jgi:hypothetical protein
METNTSLENISITERYVRFGVSCAAIVWAMESGVAAGLFAAINFAAIVLATTAIMGWDPLKSAVGRAKASLQVGRPRQTAIQGR